MSSVATLAQVNFRFRTDTAAVDSTPTWGAAENTNWSVGVETTFRLRFTVQNTGTAAGAGPFVLRVSKNGGAYTAVTTTSGATLGAQSADAGASADEATISTTRLTAGAGVFPGAQAAYDETGSLTTGLGNGNYLEFEYGLILKTAGAVNGNTFDFRVYNSTTAFNTYTRTPRLTAAVADTEDDLLANNVISTSSVSPAPQLRQEHARLANDVVSASSVSVPTLVQRWDLLANDVSSASSVSQPALVAIAGPTALLANDVLSASSVSQPAAVIRRDILANDVKSNSSVGNPALHALHGLLANDVTSNSSVGQPAAIIRRDLLANDVTSGSSVSQPAAQQRQALFANDVLSTSSVSQPSALQVHGILANDVISGSSVSQPAFAEIAIGVDGLLAEDIVSPSSVTIPALGQLHACDAAEVVSPSSVSQPALVEIAGSVEQALLAEDVISGSSVSQPAMAEAAPGQDGLLAEDVVSGSSVSQPMLDRPEVVEPPGTELGGGGKVYGRGYSRKRYRELLALLEAERRAALARAEEFPAKDRAKAKKAARAASEAIARAKAGAEEAAVAAHAAELTRLLEMAKEAKRVEEYMAEMAAVRREAIEMEDENEVEFLLLVA